MAALMSCALPDQTGCPSSSPTQTQVRYRPCVVGPRTLLQAVSDAGFTAQLANQGHTDGSALREQEKQACGMGRRAASQLAGVARLGGERSGEIAWAGPGLAGLLLAADTRMAGTSVPDQPCCLHAGQGANQCVRHTSPFPQFWRRKFLTSLIFSVSLQGRQPACSGASGLQPRSGRFRAPTACPHASMAPASFMTPVGRDCTCLAGPAVCDEHDPDVRAAGDGPCLTLPAEFIALARCSVGCSMQGSVSNEPSLLPAAVAPPQLLRMHAHPLPASLQVHPRPEAVDRVARRRLYAGRADCLCASHACSGGCVLAFVQTGRALYRPSTVQRNPFSRRAEAAWGHSRRPPHLRNAHLAGPGLVWSRAVLGGMDLPPGGIQGPASRPRQHGRARICGDKRGWAPSLLVGCRVMLCCAGRGVDNSRRRSRHGSTFSLRRPDPFACTFPRHTLPSPPFPPHPHTHHPHTPPFSHRIPRPHPPPPHTHKRTDTTPTAVVWGSHISPPTQPSSTPSCQ